MKMFKSYLSGGITRISNSRKPATMKKYALLTFGAAFGLLSIALPITIPQTHAQGTTARDFVPPTVFQAAGPNAASIQSSVDAFRAALGNPNNGNAAGPLATGRREINWDGGGADTTTDPVTPFNVFLNTRGSQFTTPGIGLSQAPPSGGPQGGLAALFNNPTYGTIFRTFSPLRLFTHRRRSTGWEWPRRQARQPEGQHACRVFQC